MTVSYKKSRSGGADYYLESGSGSDDYYTSGEKEPPGRWYVGKDNKGFRHSNLGIQHGQVFNNESSDHFKFLTNGFHPTTKESLTQNSGADNRVAIHDFTASAPKSVSVVWSQSSGSLKEEIEEIQYSSAEAMLDLLSSKAISRQGKAGVIKSEAMLRGALFGHGSSRENDPQLHTHCVMFNLVERLDMSTGALETKELMRWQGAAASMYHSEMAFKLRNKGFSIKKDGNLFEIDGVPEDVRTAFSQRRQQIEEKVKEALISIGADPSTTGASRSLFQKIALDTRTQKSELTRDELLEIWKEKGKQLGFTEEEVLNLQSGKINNFLDAEQREKSIKESVDNLLKTKSTFTEPELFKVAIIDMMGMASKEEVLDSINDFKKQLLSSENEKGQLIFTTTEMLSLEKDMLDRAVRQDGTHIQNDFKLPESLSEEQREAATAALTDKNAVTIIEGTAGAGKTFTMASVARAYEKSGYQVTGLSASWTAALNLKNDADLNDGFAITGWVSAQNKKPTINNKSLIIVDEAGTVGVEQMRDVLKIAQQHGSKVILLGDTKQQKSVGAGDALGTLSTELGSHRLDEIRRQKDVQERTAIKEIFDGNAKDGLKTFIDNNSLKLIENNTSLDEILINEWHQSRVENNSKSHIILAPDNSSVNKLNVMAHEIRKKNGEIQPGKMFETIAGLVEFSEGDEIQFRKNNQKIGVFNRSRGVITGIEDGVLRVKLNDESREVEIDTKSEAWLDDNGSLALQHGYATTVYSSQGITVDHSFIKDGSNLVRDSAGVAVSRHRESTKIYVDIDAHYQKSMKSSVSDDWIPRSDFDSEKVLSSLASQWSRANNKSSALNYEWKSSTGAIVNEKIPDLLNKTSSFNNNSAIANEHIQTESNYKSVANEIQQKLQQQISTKPSTHNRELGQ